MNSSATEIKETDQQTDSDLKLVENAFHYITDKTYSPECTKNEKHTRRKAEKLVVVNGELFYKKKDGSEVGRIFCVSGILLGTSSMTLCSGCTYKWH